MSESPEPRPRIPVICDRCRAEGSAGDDPFTAIADLLEFAPVQRRAHVNNWTAEHQRAFIAALAMTGSPRAAARALGRHVFGAEQLRKAPGGRDFDRAWDAALELYRERERFRIRDTLAALAEQQEARDGPDLAQSHLRALPPPSPARLGDEDGAGFAAPTDRDDRRTARGGWDEQPFDPDVEADDDDPGDLDERLTLTLLGRFVAKVRQERQARLRGEIALADFYLRQVTFFEVAIELASGDLLRAFEQLHRGEDQLIAIAETDFSRFIDELRRATWDELGDPPRPPVRDDLFEDRGGHRVEPLEYTRSGLPESDEQQRARFTARHRRDAEAQLRWEAEAYEDWRRRQPHPHPFPSPASGRGRNAAQPQVGEGPNEGANDP